eukprot:1142362-Pelagomonas_calceolata.AAC.7
MRISKGAQAECLMVLKQVRSARPASVLFHAALCLAFALKTQNGVNTPAAPIRPCVVDVRGTWRDTTWDLFKRDVKSSRLDFESVPMTCVF